VRKDLLGYANERVPTMMNYETMAEHRSLYNTPPTYSVYIAGLVFKYLKTQGGLAACEARNLRKANRLYDCIDASRTLTAPVNPTDRSLMNVVFKTGDPELDKKFIAGADKRGLIGLAGHRLAGGMRASIYNAMPEQGVAALIQYIEEFDRMHAGGVHVPHQDL